jgi:hypothetical protein
MTLYKHYHKLLKFYQIKLGDYLEDDNYERVIVMTEKIDYYARLIKNIPTKEIRISQLRGLVVALYKRYGEEISSGYLYIGIKLLRKKLDLEYVNGIDLEKLIIDYMISNDFMECVNGSNYNFIISKKLIRKFKLSTLI